MLPQVDVCNMACSRCYNSDYKGVFDVYRFVFWRYENKRRDQPYSIVLLLYLLRPSPDNIIVISFITSKIKILMFILMCVHTRERDSRPGFVGV